MNDTLFQWSALVNIEPISATHQSSLRILKTRAGRMFVGKPSSSKLKKWMTEFEMKVRQGGIPFSPLDGPLEAHISFRFPYLKSTPKLMVQSKMSFYKPTRPDLDNLEKAVLDSLTRMKVIVDDSNVVLKTSEKLYCSEPGIYIHIKQLPEIL